MADFNTGLPSIRRLQKALQERQSLEIKLISGDVFLGQLRWQDPDVLCVVEGDGRETLIWRQGILYLRPQGAQSTS